MQGSSAKFGFTDNGVDSTSFVRGQSNVVLGSFTVDATKSQKDVTIRSVNLTASTAQGTTAPAAPNNTVINLVALVGCVIKNGAATIATVSADPTGAGPATMKFDFNDYVIAKGAAKAYYPVVCRLSGTQADSVPTQTYSFSMATTDKVVYKVGSDSFEFAQLVPSQMVRASQSLVLVLWKIF